MSKLIYVDRLKKDILALQDCYNGFSDTYDKACIIGVIDEQPTIEERKWIPCSERLPDIKEHYVSDPCIVYCENGAYGFAELEENIFGQVGWNCERDDEYHEPLGEVVAWMPLPEPWKGEENGQTDRR